jgi:hypothetical protein
MFPEKKVVRRLSLFLFVIFLPSIAYSGAPAFYSEDFESYAGGADPSDWYDSAAGNSLLEDDSLFKVFDLGGNKALGTTSEPTIRVERTTCSLRRGATLVERRYFYADREDSRT